MASVLITTHERLGSASNGPRRFMRHRIGPLVYIDLGSSNGGFPINVSEDGLGFQGIRPLERNQLLTIKFKLPDLDCFLETAAQVKWVNEIGTGGGLRFVDLSEGSRLLIENWISSENPSASIEARLEKTKIESTFSPAPQDAQPISTAIIPAAENKSAPHEAVPIASVILQTSYLFPAAQAEAAVTPVSTPGPLRSVDPTAASRTPSFLRGSGEKRSRSTPYMLFAIAGIVIIAVVGLISLEFRAGASLGSQLEKIKGNIAPLFSSSTPIATLPPSLKTEIGDRPGSGPAITAPVLSSVPPVAVSTSMPATATAGEKSIVPSQVARGVATGARAKTGASKTSAKKLTAFTKVLAPRTITRAATTDVVPPTVAPPIRQQPAALLPIMGLPEPPAPNASRPVQPPSTLEAARLLAHRDPLYPELAKANHYSGSVDLLFTIGVDGKVHNIRVVKGNNMLAQAAVEAVKGWHFQPARRDGSPIETESSTVVTFKLN